MADTAPEILTPAETAKLIRRSTETLKYWRLRGEGPASWRSGRRVFYDRSAVLAWLDEQRTSGAHSGGAGAA